MANRENKFDNKRLNRFMSKLSPKKISQGMNCAISNAERLVADAELLYQNKRYPSAVGLAILAIEEDGKVAIMRSLAVSRNEEDVREAWRDYRTHTKKNLMLAMPEMVALGARKLEDFRPIFTETEYPQLFENLKQISFYTDCLGKAHWSIPAEVIDEELTKRIVSLAKGLIGKTREVTEKEIELWIKHVGPVWKKEMDQMKIGLKNFFIEMHSIGLLKGKIEDCLDFVDSRKKWVH